MSKILNIIGKKKELLERKIGENKSKIDWSLLYSYMHVHIHTVASYKSYIM